MTEHQCIDCKASTTPPIRPRPIVNPDVGPPRCATHTRAFKTHSRKRARARQVERAYGISDEDNHALFLLQNGLCWLCQKATGATKSLAVDHDHATGEVRGRLCGPCNQFIGRLGDDPGAAQRLVGYLTGDTPYRRLKARQTLEAAMPPGAHPPGSEIVVRAVVERGSELVADWGLSTRADAYRSLVRGVDGAWQAIP